MAKVEFATESYRRSHGVQPRGLGFWSFEIGSQALQQLRASGVKLPNMDVYASSFGARGVINCSGGARSLAEAKKLVRELFRLGIADEYTYTVEVAP